MMQNRASQMDSELAGMGNTMPPAFVWYYQYGYKDRWNNPENHDPSMKRTFDEYITEAMEKGWWDASYSKAYQEVEPRVLYEVGRQSCCGASAAGRSSFWSTCGRSSR